MPRAAGAVNRAAAAHGMEKLCNARAAQRIAPGWRDLGQRLEYESAASESGVREDEARRGEGTFGPQDDVEVEYARPPAAAAAAAEIALRCLEEIEEGRRVEAGLEDRGGIGEAAPRRADRLGAPDRREALDAESLGCGAQGRGRGPVAPGPVRAEGDRVACQRHRERPRRSGCIASPPPSPLLCLGRKRRATARFARASSPFGRRCAPSIPTGGTRPCRISAIPRPGSPFAASRRENRGRTGRGGRSPGISPGCCSTRRWRNSASPRGAIRSGPTTA